MRILHLVAYSLYSGPIPSTVGLALAQRRAGHTVWLAYDSKRGAFNDYEEAASPRVRPVHLGAPLPLTLSTKSAVGEWWRDVRTLRRFFSQGSVDVVHVHLSHDHGLAALAALGVRASARPTLIRSVHAERSLRRRPGQRWLMGRADGVIVRCAEHRTRFVSGFYRRAGFGHSEPPPVHVIPGGIDLETFRPPTESERRQARERFDLPPQAFVVGQVALIADRGQRELLAALAALAALQPQLHILFVGRGEGEGELRRQVASLGLQQRVRFAGYLQGAALLAGYAAMDAAWVAQPGNDASSRAALEAMACGIPVLGVQSGALAELVTPETGYPVAARQGEVLATAIRAVMGSQRGQSLGRPRRALQCVSEERTFDREAARTEELYEEARLSSGSAQV